MVRMVDGTQVFRDACERIKQLEQLNAQLAAEIDAMTPVVQAAKVVADIGIGGWVHLREKVDAYEAAKEGGDGLSPTR